jgi:hypothetical protein
MSEMRAIFADGLIQALIYFSGLFLVAYAAVVLCRHLRRAADAKARPKVRQRPRPAATGSELGHRTVGNSAAPAPTARTVA